jgi:ankyrin repeat protein
VRAGDKDGWTALHVALHQLVVDLLLKHGADVKTATTTGWTALHAALHNGHELVVKLLVQNGA